MLCLQQCIDMCNLSPEEARIIGEAATLPEILAHQDRCSRLGALPRDGVDDTVTEAANVIGCQLLSMVRSADSFSDLHRVAIRYRAYRLARASSEQADQA